jgi:Ca-activated chloride channel family protein
LNEAVLKAIADTTGGEYFYAKDAADLQKIYGNLGLNVVLKTEKQELTVWFTLAAAILAVAALGLSLWWTSLN